MGVLLRSVEERRCGGGFTRVSYLFVFWFSSNSAKQIEGGLTPAEAHAEVQRVLGEFHDERPLDSDPSLTALSPSVIEGCSRYFSSPGPCFKVCLPSVWRACS